MFYLYNSNRTEILARQLGVVINASDGRSLFDKSLFLVQSREMGRMLSQFLADRFGVWCNSEYMLPLRFIEHICELMNIEIDISAYDRSVLTWRIERLLRETGDHPLQPLASYLSGDQQELKRYQLARAIAQLFDQYQIMRPNLIDSWNNGRIVTDNSSEPWQMHLWKLLREEVNGSNRGQVIGNLIERVTAAAAGTENLPKSVYVFGIHTLPPMFVSVLNALSGFIDVHFFLLTPCSHYWADMESKSARIRRTFKENREDGENDLEFHQLLAGLGRQGADFQHILLDQIEQKIDRPEVYVVNAEFGHTRVLQRLQDDVLEGRYEAGCYPVSDDSIKVVSCHSKMRELGVLKDYIIDWLTTDPDLGLHEIVVMAPDIQQYGDLIPALFNDIAHDITDCRNRRDNRYFAVFSEFLEIFTDRYSGPDIVSLIEHPEVRRTYDIASGDLEMVKRWLADVGIRWGLSESQRKEDGLPVFRGGTWQEGLERMLLGMASGTSDRIGAILPYTDVEGSDAELLGNLCLFIEMIDQCRGIVAFPHTLAQWSLLLHQFTTRLFGDDDSPDLLYLQELLTGLGEQFGPYHEEPVSFEVVRQWFEYEAETKSASGFLRGRLTFCSMLPMRSIPFKIICLLGINDGEFPNQDRFTPFDLLSHEYKKGDRSRRADDRYQFLEAIMAARQRLYISYIGQSIRTNDEIPPSPVVSELIETISHCYGSIGVQKHPLQPFSEAYFTGDGDLFSHSRYYCQTAQSFRSEPKVDSRGWLAEPLDVKQSDLLYLSELLNFITNPQRYFVRKILGMSLDTTEALPAEQEVFSLAGLDRYQINQYLAQEMMNGRRGEDLLDEMQQRQAWPLAYPGHDLFEHVTDELDGFIARVKAIEPAEFLEPVEFELDIDTIGLTGTLSRCSDGGLLFYRFAELKGGDLLRAWLCHLIGCALVKEKRPTRVVAKDRTVTIPADAGSDDDLHLLLNWYRDGCRYPSQRFVEPAFAYCEQVISNRGRGRTDPLYKARNTLKQSIDNGYAEELVVLFRDVSVESLINDEFEKWCNEDLLKIWEISDFRNG